MINEPEWKRLKQAREPVRMLLVEDDPRFADLLQTQLRRMPWVESRLEVAATLADALDRLADGRFGLILTDLNLPDSKGVATVDALARSGEQLVIVLSGDATPTLRASALECGAYDFLHKDNLSAAALERLVRLASLQANTFRSLRDSESRFRSLIDLSSDLFWESDAAHRVMKLEHGPKRRTVLNAELLGKTRWELPSIHPGTEGWAAHRATMEAHLPFSDFEVARIEDGVTRWRSISGEPVFGADGAFRGYRGIGRDITAFKRVEDELRRFRLALDTSPDMILIIDRAEMRHVDVNSTFCRLLGYSREELLAMGPQDVLPLPRDEIERVYDTMIADPSRVTGMRSQYRCRDGSLLPFESTRRVLRSGERWLIAVISRDIRERIAAEAALRESEARFRSLTALSSDWYWEQDAEYRIAYMSNLEKTGLDPGQYIGRRRWDLPALNLSEADWARHRAQLERREPFHDLEIERPAPSAGGGTVWISLSGEPVLDEQGGFAGYRGVGRDITARKQGERQVQLLTRMYRALGAANEAILRAKSEQEVFERACEIAVEAGEFLIGTVFRTAAEGKRLVRVAASGPLAAELARAVPSIDEPEPGRHALLIRARESGRPAISNEHPVGRRDEIGSAAVFPLKVEGGLVGVFALQHARTHAFNDELCGLLQRLSDNISFALEGFALEARRRRAKRKLGQSEQRFRSLTDLSSDLYWEQDAEYRFTSFSGTAAERNRRGRDSMIGKRRWDAHYFNMSEADWAAHRAALDARQPFHDLELGRVNAAGEKVWASVSGEPMFDDAGNFRGYRGIGKDITARKRVAQLRELEHSVTRYLSKADSLDEALRGAIRAVCETEGWDCGRYFAADAKAGVVRFAAAWGVDHEQVRVFLERSRGLVYRPGEGLSGRVWQTAQPMWVTDVFSDARSAQPQLSRSTGMHGAFIFPVVADGRTIGVLGFNSRDLRQPEEALLQAIGAIGSQIGQFVQRKQSEEVLRESEARFRSLTNLSSDWYWEQDAEFRFTKFEGKAAGGRYMPATAVLGKPVWELEGVEGDSADWHAHRARLARHESFHQFEYCYRDRSGKRYYVSADGEAVFDAAGGFAGYRGTSRDVTAQRRGEEELRRFRAAMDMSIDAIYLVDRASMRFLDVNEAACRGVGYSREQLLAMGPADLLKAPRAEIERTYDEVIARSPGGVMAENSYVGANGRTRWTELHRRALRAGDGWIIVSVSRDITERKLSEQRQGEHLRYQERIARFGQSALLRRDPGELIEKAVQAVLEALGAEAVAYLESEPGLEGLVLRALVGVADPGPPPGTLACGPGTELGRVMQSGARVLAEGAKLPFAWSRELRSAALVPVRGESKARGVLCIAYRGADAFTAEALNFVDAAASVVSTALQRIDSESRLAYLAQFDALTGLPNRALLADRFSQMIGQARRRGSALAALFIDLDGFKLVNDTLGHAGGDALLKETAVRLQASVRTGDTVARISGDEFAVVLADLARLEDAALVAQKIIDRLAAPYDVHGKEVFVTASVGIAVFPGDGADAETLIGAADAAMYRAKQSGRNAFQFFTAEINQRSRARAQLGVELRHAVEREEFELHYQPKIDLGSRRPTGAEALLRWKHPRRGMVSPVEFIPVLEETGLIIAVGDWVLRRACEDLKAWQAGGVLPISVNLSARQFRQQDLDARIKGIVGAAGIDPALIELEITESQLMQDPDQAIRVMRALRDAGMRIAIDDFGTGYSSLAYLTRFPVGALKIDRSFVKEMSSDQGDATIVRTIIEMAHTLGFTVVAEGVETEQQANFLRLLRCEQAQGYLFARPMPAAELAAFFQKGG